MGFTIPEKNDLVYTMGMNGDIFGMEEINIDSDDLQEVNHKRLFNVQVLSDNLETMRISITGL